MWMVCSLGTLAASGNPSRGSAIEEKDRDSKTAARLLLDQVYAQYRSAQTYQASGNAMTVIVMPESNTETSIEATFTMKLARPHYYRIEWTQHFEKPATQAGAVWNNGEGPHLYRSSTASLVRMESNQSALSAATGDSMAIAHIIPTLFFHFDDKPNLLESLEDVDLEGSQTIAGKPCHIVSGRVKNGIDYRLWISTNELFLIQVEYTLGGTLGGDAIVDPTPEQEERALKATGREVTAENREWLRESLRKARDIMASVRGTSKQVHLHVDMTRPIPTEAFSFSLPEDETKK